MRQRQMEFYQGWDQEEAMKQKSSIGEEGNSRFHEEIEGDDDARIEAEALQAEVQAKEEEEEQSEPVCPTISSLAVYAVQSLLIILQEFNMAHMLQSLGIDLSLLGYDEVEEKWTD